LQSARLTCLFDKAKMLLMRTRSATGPKPNRYWASLHTMILLTVSALAVLSGAGCRRDVAAYEACIGKMKAIDGAIAIWAMEQHKTTNDVVTWPDLVGPDKYLRERPVCPHGGVYSITTVGAGPTCSIPQDTAYFRQRCRLANRWSPRHPALNEKWEI